ncbi:hypothetical protein [Mycolicibacterium mageritense]|uniref:hypothetical protein n=1 Tax=Mycolicibacterium mageritense TaxID=53462 RepID=UPI0011D40EEC|nr:hypothetical protein [Mycolicibacterium mageritense]TXI62489.1 MAG: hypothetical protein E6Q55_12765 [Mycolicibacterium mageritense]
METTRSTGSSWVKWVVIAVAVIVVGSGAWYAFGYFATKGTIDAVTDAMEQSSSPREPGELDTESGPLDMFNTDITNEGYGRQLDVTLPYLQEHRAQSMQEAVAERELQNKTHFTNPSEHAGDPAKQAAQQDQNNISADLWTISKETNPILARNLLNSVFWNDPNNSNDAFDNTLKLLGNVKGKILEPTYVFEVSPTYTQGLVVNTEADGQPTYLAKLSSDNDGRIYEEVISKRISEGGKFSTNVVVTTIKGTEPAFVENPSQMPQQR